MTHCLTWMALLGVLGCAEPRAAEGSADERMFAASAPAAAATTPDPTGGQRPSELRPGEPELPRVWVNTKMPAVAGRSIRVAAGADLQAAINAAQPGDELVLAPGATYTGTFRLPKKSGDAWIVIRSGGTLPPPGTRVTPAAAAQMPKLISPWATEPVLRTEAGAHHWRLVGLELTAVEGATQAYSLLQLGDGDSRAQFTLAQQPHHLVLDRVYVHGTPTLSFQRCIALNSAETAIIDSWIAECHGRGVESHAIGGWNGAGPYKIVNNHIAGAGINLLLGGATPGLSGMVPSDIEIRRNHFTKPPAWQGVWSVKNLFELKNARRVLIEGNVFENNWVDAQTGFAILLKSSAGSDAPWTVVEDVTFRHNIVRNSPAGLNLAARPDGPAQPARRLHFEHNLFTAIGEYAGSGSGRMVMLLGDLQDVSFERNTFVHNTSYGHLMIMDGTPGRNLTFRQNIATRGEYGVFGSGSSEGAASLTQYWGTAHEFTGNVLVGVDVGRYPKGNRSVASLAAVGFINPAGEDYRLRSRSDFDSVGANVEAVLAATRGVVVAPR